MSDRGTGTSRPPRTNPSQSVRAKTTSIDWLDGALIGFVIGAGLVNLTYGVLFATGVL